MAHAVSTYKVIEYIIDPNQSFVGKVPEGKVVKTFTGKDAMQKAYDHSGKLNDKETEKALKNSNKESKGEIKGYYVKGDIAVAGKGIYGS